MSTNPVILLVRAVSGKNVLQVAKSIWSSSVASEFHAILYGHCCRARLSDSKPACWLQHMGLETSTKGKPIAGPFWQCRNTGETARSILRTMPAEGLWYQGSAEQLYSRRLGKKQTSRHIHSQTRVEKKTTTKKNNPTRQPITGRNLSC